MGAEVTVASVLHRIPLAIILLVQLCEPAVLTAKNPTAHLIAQPDVAASGSTVNHLHSAVSSQSIIHGAASNYAPLLRFNADDAVDQYGRPINSYNNGHGRYDYNVDNNEFGSIETESDRYNDADFRDEGQFMDTQGYKHYKTQTSFALNGPKQLEKITTKSYQREVAPYDVSGFQHEHHGDEEHAEVHYHQHKHMHKHSHKQAHKHHHKNEHKHEHGHKHAHKGKHSHHHLSEHKHEHHGHHKHEHKSEHKHAHHSNHKHGHKGMHHHSHKHHGEHKHDSHHSHKHDHHADHKHNHHADHKHDHHHDHKHHSDHKHKHSHHGKHEHKHGHDHKHKHEHKSSHHHGHKYMGKHY